MSEKRKTKVFPALCRKRTPEEISANLKSLRNIIETEQDQILVRIAYEMEIAVRWATEDTADWPDLEQSARDAAHILRSDLFGSQH